jgi:membrane fusion protein (multidrug efflux system)
VSNNLNKLNAEIAVLEVDLGKTEIRAPFAGKIGLRNVSEGAMVNPEVVLAMLHDISQVKIDFAIPERYANDLRAGARVTFTTDYSTEIFNSVVEAVEPAVDFNTRTILLRSVADNRQGKLVAGSSVKVNLDIRAFDKSLFIPTSALIPSIKGYTVFLIKSGKAVSQVVKTGIRNKSSIQVLEGLALGDTLVTTNLLRVKKDVPLKIINAP